MSPAPTAATTTPGTAAAETAAAGTAALPPATGRLPTGYHYRSQRERYDRTSNRPQRITDSGLAKHAELPDCPPQAGGGTPSRAAARGRAPPSGRGAAGIVAGLS